MVSKTANNQARTQNTIFIPNFQTLLFFPQFPFTYLGAIEIRSQFTHEAETDTHEDDYWYYYTSLKTMRRFVYIGDSLYAISGDSISSYDLTQDSLPRIQRTDLQ